MSQLFSPLKIRAATFKNRIFVSPMCQYSCEEGLPNEWHLVHLGSRAIGGAALVMAEATSVSPEGRISPYDTGIWNDAQAAAFGKITKFIRENGALSGIQIAHAGRKASTNPSWIAPRHLLPEQGGWKPVAPSSVPFDEKSQKPLELSKVQIQSIVTEFVQAAERSKLADFDVVELHMAHGYLLHEFLSPLSNMRTDEYGGDLPSRMRFPLEVAQRVREIWPNDKPLFARISSSDWIEGSWNDEDSVSFSRELKKVGVDLIDCSSGGNVPDAKIPLGPGYQVPFAEKVRREANIATGAVGLITDPRQAEKIISQGQADAVLIARELLRDPYWPLHAANVLGVDVPWPKQYARAKP